jgi:hypothetical protein
VNPALLFPLAVVVLAAVAGGAAWIAYGAGIDHARGQAETEAADQLEAELTEAEIWRAAQDEAGALAWAALGERGGPWPELGAWHVPDRLGFELPAGAPWDIPYDAEPLDVQDATARPATSPTDLILGVLHQCDQTERYVQNLIDRNQEIRGGAPDGG